jgi:hypothetical protein
VSSLAAADDIRLAAPPGVALWSRIVSELARLQDAAPAESAGAVVNPICGAPYVLDACCAAAVFAAEFRRTDDERWRQRALAAVRAAQAHGIFRGIDEPRWDSLGWHNAPFSLPATGMAVDAYFDALKRLELPVEKEQVEGLLGFLSACRTETKGFVHNALRPGQRGPEVQNATASALNLLGRLRRECGLDGHPLYADLETTVSRLGRGQSASGFWPYHYPGARWREALDRPVLSTLLRPRRFFYYGGGGDITHHLMTLYFAAQYFSSAGERADTGPLAAGWRWIKKRLVRSADGGVSIDWSGDPVPTTPRYTNGRDVNAYFLILGVMPLLADAAVVDSDESGAIARGLMAHIESHLVSPGHTPCVVPYDAPVEIARNILPMFEQSVAWKGRLMADVISPQ